MIYIYDHNTLRQLLEKFECYGYTAVPVIDRDGCYLGTITEGDLLREIKNQCFLNIKQAQDVLVGSIDRKHQYNAVSVNTEMDDLIHKALSQNFVPVVDDRGVFIGIITRREIINYYYSHSRETNNIISPAIHHSHNHPSTPLRG